MASQPQGTGPYQAVPSVDETEKQIEAKTTEKQTEDQLIAKKVKIVLVITSYFVVSM